MKISHILSLTAGLTFACNANAVPFEQVFCLVESTGQEKVARAASQFVATPIANLEIVPIGSEKVAIEATAACKKRFGWNDAEAIEAFRYMVAQSADFNLREQLFAAQLDVNIVDRVYKSEPSLEAMIGLWTQPEYRDALAERLVKAGVPRRKSNGTDLVTLSMNVIRSRMVTKKLMQQFEFAVAGD